MILVHIGTLLLPVFFRNSKVNIADCFKKLLTLLISKVCFLMLFIPLELIRRNYHYKINSTLLLFLAS